MSQTKQSTNCSSPGENGIEGISSSAASSSSSSSKHDRNGFVGKEKLLEDFYRQLKYFDEWNENKDWLAFHHHHYDWWMFPIDEISSRGAAYQLTEDVIHDLSRNNEYISDLRRGVQMMVRSWDWDIDNARFYHQLDDKKNQKWSYWPVRLYKAGRCMYLFHQDDYYQSLKQLAYHIKKTEKLDFFSHTQNGKVDVLEQWTRMEERKSF